MLNENSTQNLVHLRHSLENVVASAASINTLISDVNIRYKGKGKRGFG